MIREPHCYIHNILEDLRSLCKKERLIQAIQKLTLLLQQGAHAPSEIICLLLQSCIKKKDIVAGRQLQSLLLKDGLLLYEPVVGDHIIRMFASCSSLQEATEAFDNVQNPTIYTWNAIISAHSKLDEGERAIELFSEMQLQGINPDKFTFLPVLRACGSAVRIAKGRVVHNLIVRDVLESDASIGNALLDMYLKCGSLQEGHKLFITLRRRDVVSWGAIIDGYTQHGCGSMALELFTNMRQEGYIPNRVIYSCVLKACGSVEALTEGRLVYSQILRSEIDLDEGIANHLVDMYVKCKNLDEGFKALVTWPKRDVVSWGTLITGYAQQGDSSSALRLFYEMRQDGMRPDRVVFLSVLQACSTAGTENQGKIIHDLLIRSGLSLDVTVGSTLVDMYAKSGSFKEAHNVLLSMSHRDAVSWGALISGYAQHGHGHSAIESFEKMQKDGVEPDSYVFSCTLKACGGVGALEHGRLMHDQILKIGFTVDTVVGSTLVDMYAKCGSLVEGWKTLDQMQSQDVVSWNALIAGYAQHCDYALAQQCLQVMQAQGVKPDSTTFLSVLAACSHAGNVEDGQWYFKSMVKDDIKPTMEHFNCMIDLFGRAGYLNDAVKLLNSMPTLPNVTGWTSLLATCQKYQDVSLGRLCFHQILQLDPYNAAGFMLMSNLFADADMWKDVEKLNELRKGDFA